VDLVKVWLEKGTFFIGVEGECLYLHDILLGNIQGPMLGPVFDAIYVSPQIKSLLVFADDTYISRLG
jgi:hypothetical protein